MTIKISQMDITLRLLCMVYHLNHHEIGLPQLQSQPFHNITENRRWDTHTIKKYPQRLIGVIDAILVNHW
jgi:hypothetical protein